MRKQRTYSPAQIQAREERKARFAAIVAQVAEMDDDARAAFAERLPTVITCEGHPLSLRNTLLIALQRAEPVSMVGGFRQWIKQGRCVRKGEHGVSILFPRTFGAKPNDNDGSAAEETASTAANGKGKKRMAFLTGTVFDVAQTDPLEAHNDDRGADAERPTLNGYGTIETAEAPTSRRSLFNCPPPGGWTDADKVRKEPTPQVPALAGMSPLGIAPKVVQVTPEQFGTPAATAAALTIWNSDGTDGPCLICPPPSPNEQPEKIADAREITPARDGELFAQSILNARYKGTCAKCGHAFPAGTLIRYGRGRAEHETCPSAPQNGAAEDYACTDQGYEDQCSRACGEGL